MAVYNPLNEFNTFSYHHFLVVVNSTEVANRLNDSSLFFRFATGEEEVDGAWMVINPLKDTQYVIQELEWTNLLAMNASEFGATVGIGGSMTIIEPNGMGFMNTLFNVFEKLNCSPSTSQWVLKTIFVGDTGVGSSENPTVDYINYVNPFTLTIYETDISYTEAGGEYKFEFVSATSGGLLPTMNETPFLTDNGVDLTRNGQVTGAITLEHALKTLEMHINESINASFDQFNQANTAARGNSAGNYHKMEYVINVPESLKRSDYIVETTTRNHNFFTIQPGLGLHQAVNQLIRMCPALNEEGQLSSPQFVYRCEQSQVVRSATANPRTRTKIVCNIFKRNMDDGMEPVDPTSGELTIQDQRAIATGNFLEFDYLYTGKNIDVLSFDMKMAGTGMSFLATLLPMNTITSDRADPKKGETRPSTSNITETGTSTPPPFVKSAIPSVGVLHSTDPAAQARYEELLQQHTALNTLVTLRIRGNPNLLNDFTPSMDDEGNIDVKTKAGVVANFYSEPIRCRINIKMPKHGDPTELEDFWYRGSYIVLSAKNTFTGGEFIQELQMVVELDGQLKFTQEQQPAPPAPEAPRVEITGETATSAARVRAFLSMVRFCEGTDSPQGYNMLFGGKLFTGYDDHPNDMQRYPGYDSTAAGAYQIMFDTWTAPLRTKYKAHVPDFTPKSQDKAGWCLLDRRGALPLIRNGQIREAIYACREEWAGLPESPYNQTPKSWDQAITAYNKYLTDEMAGITILAADYTELS